ncbi:MAG: hypothetical protein FWH41_05245 [Treponema sp.]|nr:hypothetical protein [Treponema sp.]MCL2138918.1 hypothetical protein [Treponema sp.]
MAKKGITSVALTVVLFLFMGTGLYAQLGPRLIESPEKEATATQFWSDPDNFISVTGYNSVEFDKWFGVVSFAPFGGNANNAQIGFAANFGSVYTALCYGGNMARLGQHRYTEAEINMYGTNKTMRNYTGLNAINPSAPIYNELALLIGVADMGFRLSVDSSYHTRKIDDVFTVNGTDFYKGFKDQRGNINPEIAWGMAKPLLSNGLQPHAYLNFDFGRDSQKYQVYDNASDLSDYIGRSNNSLSLGLTAASGAYSIFNRGGFDLSLDLWYFFDITTYNNEYNYLDESDPTAMNGIKKGYKGRYDGTSFMEESSNNHLVIPCVYAFWEGEKISLAAELDLGLGFGFEKNIDLDYRRIQDQLAPGTWLQDGSGVLVKDGSDAKISYIMFNPVIYLGMKWAIVPEKFFFNAGLKLDLGYPQSTTKKSVEYNRGEKANNSDEKDVTKDYTGASTTLTLGVTFNPTVNLGFQAMCGVAANNDLSVFNATNSGLLYFSKILATLRF